MSLLLVLAVGRTVAIYIRIIDMRVRDLNISQRQVFLKVNRRQFKCLKCGKPFSEELDFIGRRRKHTDRYAQQIVQQVLHSDTHNVAGNNDLTDEEVWSMVQYISKKKLRIDLSLLKRLVAQARNNPRLRFMQISRLRLIILV